MLMTHELIGWERHQRHNLNAVDMERNNKLDNKKKHTGKGQVHPRTGH
jgi:hypothetical protein